MNDIEKPIDKNNKAESGEDADSVRLEEASRLDTFLQEVGLERPLWTGDDLRAILEHQWHAPLTMDLSAMKTIRADQLWLMAEARGLVLRSFGDLLTHSHPPVELLELTKEFAKRSLSSERSAIPHDVARVLYFACIASALAKCKRRITKLDDNGILEGIRWACTRSWVMEPVKHVLEEGRKALIGEELSEQ